jgi:hypothetical protein
MTASTSPQSDASRPDRNAGTTPVAAGWYPCPTGVARLRYWDGAAWTDRTRPDVLAWVHGPRATDIPGVFSYGAPPPSAPDDRPEPLEPWIWRRARNNLIALVVLYFGLSWLAGFVEEQIGVPAPGRDPIYGLVLIVVLGWRGRWATVARYLWLRFRPAPRAPAPPPARTEDLRSELRAAGHADAAARLDQEIAAGRITDVDYVRIARALRRAGAHDTTSLAPAAAQIERGGASAWLHPSGQHDLPARRAQHDLVTGQVRLGLTATTPKNPPTHRGLWFALDTEALRTSMLVIGPPGAGKTRGFAQPVVEMLGLQTLVNMSSVVVIDANGTDLDMPGAYDIDIDAAKPSGLWGFDLFGGATSPAEAADRLAGALLPDGSSGADAARNALDAVLGAWHALRGGYPGLRQLVDALDGGAVIAELRAEALAAAAEKTLDAGVERRIATRERQLASGTDPAADLVERLRLLDRPELVALFDERPRRFAMRDIDRPLRVRIALPEGSYPQAARIMARLAIAQFVQVVAAPGADRSVFKGLVVDNAGRFMDSYVVQGLQRARAANAGLVLLVQSMREFPEELRATVFANTGCKAVFAGVDPSDATYVADWWGKNWTPETVVTSGTSTLVGGPRQPGLRGLGSRDQVTQQRSVSTRAVERYLWSPSEIINDIPVGHALVSLARPDGVRTGPILVNVRG